MFQTFYFWIMSINVIKHNYRPKEDFLNVKQTYKSIHVSVHVSVRPSWLNNVWHYNHRLVLTACLWTVEGKPMQTTVWRQLYVTVTLSWGSNPGLLAVSRQCYHPLSYHTGLVVKVLNYLRSWKVQVSLLLLSECHCWALQQGNKAFDPQVHS